LKYAELNNNNKNSNVQSLIIIQLYFQLQCFVSESARRLNASTGLSSVASFSLGLSMSMRGPADSTSSPCGEGGDNFRGDLIRTSLQQQQQQQRRPDGLPTNAVHSPAPTFYQAGIRRMTLATSSSRRKQSFQELFPVHSVAPHVDAFHRTANSIRQHFKRPSAHGLKYINIFSCLKSFTN